MTPQPENSIQLTTMGCTASGHSQQPNTDYQTHAANVVAHNHFQKLDAPERSTVVQKSHLLSNKIFALPDTDLAAKDSAFPASELSIGSSKWGLIEWKHPSQFAGY
jgi:hypothetical protein